MTSWVLNEPWPNGGGPYLVDYDGRPLMNYGFMKQALAPVSLSLRHSSNLYDPAAGLNAQLWAGQRCAGALVQPALALAFTRHGGPCAVSE